MRQGIDMRNSLPVKDHANKLSGAAADTPPFWGISVSPFAAIDHIPLRSVYAMWQVCRCTLRQGPAEPAYPCFSSSVA